jgi:hypothetical protein
MQRANRIMKIIISLFIAAIVICCAKFLLTEHEWKVTIKVVDETGQPIAGAKTSVGYYSHSQPASIDGLTDKDGIFKASHFTSAIIADLGFSAEKAGYYITRPPGIELRNYGQYSDLSKWKFTETIVLKKIGKPIPMYARKAQIEMPAVDKPIGFDLMKGDWVSPYGQGNQSDFIFTAQRRWVSRNDFNSAVKITFPNSSDGLVPVSIPSNQGSELRMPAVAPPEGYVSELSKSLSHTPADGWAKNGKHDKGYSSGEDLEQNYYLRVRTVLDSQGNMKSALYGKIHGEFALDPINSKTTWIVFTYYLNPELNSRNVEFNPKQNLSENLKLDEGVNAP